MTGTTIEGAPAVPAIEAAFQPVSDKSAVARAASLVAEVCQKSGIEPALLRSTLASQEIRGLDDTIDYVCGRTARRPSLARMARLVTAVEQVLKFDEPLAVDLRSWTAKAVEYGRDAITGSIFIVCVWLVVGGMFTGQNAMANATSPLVTFAVLAASVGFLSLLEAAHIGAVALCGANVSELRASHPRMVKLHPRIATKGRLEHYLAGRQAGVVLVVFAVAEVTRTSGMTNLPWTSIALPRTLDVLFAIGVPGALVVLVLGQVAPQLITARRPAAMMNTAPMAFAFQVTLGVAQLGLANPARWFAGRGGEEERIPTAKEQQHQATTLDIVGNGIDTVCRTLRVGMAGSISKTVTTTTFHRGGLTDHTVEIASTPFPASSTDPRVALLRGGEASEVVVLHSDVYVTKGEQARRYVETVAPRLGTFEAGDVLRTNFKATMPQLLASDAVAITAPTRTVIFSVTLEHPSTPLPPARLVIYDSNGGIVEASQVKPNMDELDGSVEFVVVVAFPVVGGIVALDWSVAA